MEQLASSELLYVAVVMSLLISGVLLGLVIHMLRTLEWSSEEALEDALKGCPLCRGYTIDEVEELIELAKKRREKE